MLPRILKFDLVICKLHLSAAYSIAKFSSQLFDQITDSFKFFIEKINYRFRALKFSKASSPTAK